MVSILLLMVLFGTALVAALLFRLVGIPSIVGFLLAGVAIGPSGLEVIARESVEHFAEIGLVLLLFVIGLELSPQPLIKAGPRLTLAAFLQMLFTTVFGAVVLRLLGLSWTIASILGLAASPSSSAIALKQLYDRGETNSTAGLAMTGVTLLQDVITIFFMLLLSMLLPTKGAVSELSVPVRIMVSFAGIAVTVALARKILPRVIDQVIQIGGRELIGLLAVLGAAAGAWITSAVGWSPALGAFIAGFLLSDADQRHQMTAEIMPFRDVFNAIFFMSLGMLLNVATVVDNIIIVLIVVAVISIMKPLLTAAGVMVAGWPLRIGIHVGIGLCTISEFGYIFAFDTFRRGLLPANLLDITVACTVGTMIVGALVFPIAGPAATGVSSFVLRGRRAQVLEKHPEEGFHDHVLLVGYGVTGSNLAKMLKSTHLPYCVVEMNQTLVQAAREADVPVTVGDATRMAILEVAGIDSARVLVVAINDVQATQRIVAQVAVRRPELYILVRTSFLAEIDALQKLGARLVIPEDLETSIEVAAHVLRQYGVPDNIIEAQIASVRAGGYAILRGRPAERAAYRELIQILQRTTTQTFYLTETSEVCGKSIAELNLRARTGCMIVAVVRNGEPTTNPAPDFVLECNDVLVLVGAHRQLEDAKGILRAAENNTEPQDAKAQR